MNKEASEPTPLHTHYARNTLRAILRAFTISLLFMAGMVLIIISGAFIWPRNPVAIRLKQWWMKLSLKLLGIKVKVHGQAPNRLRGSTRSALWISNHISWVDINVLNSLVPLTFLSKAEVKAWPIIGMLASATGTLFVARGAGNRTQAVNQVAEVLNSNQSVVVFPEATTTDGTDLRRFFHPIFGAAMKYLHPIIPITIVYERQGERCQLTPYFGNDVIGQHLWRLLHLKGITAHVTFHPSRRTTTSDTAKTLSKDTEQVVRTGLTPF